MMSKSSLNRGEVNSSAGFAGRGPQGRAERLGTIVGRIAEVRSACPAITDARPVSCGIENILWMRGRRQSASMMIVFLPDCAIDTARLHANVDLPSAMFGLVTWMT